MNGALSGTGAVRAALRTSRWCGDGVTLEAIDLLSKNGFDDGDLLDELIETMGLIGTPRRMVPGDPEEEESLKHAALEALVMERLAPLLPEMEINGGISMCHNPIRATTPDEWGDDQAWSVLGGVSVVVPLDDVRALVTRIAASFPGT